jgi:hypothetical protein
MLTRAMFVFLGDSGTIDRLAAQRHYQVRQLHLKLHQSGLVVGMMLVPVQRRGGQTPDAVQEVQDLIGGLEGCGWSARSKYRSFVRFRCPEHGEAGMIRTRKSYFRKSLRISSAVMASLLSSLTAGIVPPLSMLLPRRARREYC